MIHLMDALTLKKLLANDEVFIVDVREESEHEESSILGSVLIPLGEFSIEKVKRLNTENKKIVIHCRSGGRSLRACKIAVSQDSNVDVYNLEGGITAWSNESKSCSGEGCNISSGGCSTK